MNTQTSHAQSNFKDGLIVTQHGDSIQGQIDDREWIKTPDAIRFRTDNESEIQTFTPLDLMTFHVAGRWYKSAIVPVDQTPLKARLTRPAVTPTSKKDTVFLSVLVKGPLTLYHHKDKRRHFYLEQSSKIIELISREYKIERDSDTFIYKEKSKEFIKQINRFVPLCMDLNTEAVHYNKSSMKAFVVQCNKQLSPTGPSYVTKTESPTFESSILFGVSRPNFKVNFRNGSVPFHKTRNFTVGYTGRIILPGRRGRRMLFISLRYNWIKSQNTQNYSNVVWDGMCISTSTGHYCEKSKVEESYEDMNVDVGYLNLATGYRHQLSAGLLRPYTEFGLSVAKRIHYKADGHHTIRLYQFKGNKNPSDEDMELVDTYSGRDEFLKPYNFSVGGFIGTGIKLGGVNLALRNDLNFFASNSSLLRTLYLTVGFDLSD